MSTWEIVLWSAVLVVAAVWPLYRLVVAARTYFRFRGERLVICPETNRAASVHVAAGKAAVKTFAGMGRVRLDECSRWPERAGCGQDCLSQVEADPASCLVWNIVHQWYAGKKCAKCGKPFTHINWHDHRPALLDSEGKTVQWTEVPPEELPAYFATHWPVCWNCHIGESFRREHPELVTDRRPH